VLTGCGAALVAGLFPIDILGELVSIGTLLAFVTVCIGVLVLRHTQPALPRACRVPAPWFTCPAGVLVCGFLMYSLPTDTWMRLLAWTVLGFVVYFLYGHRRSAMRATANRA
jgi:APA family basic amino acid/polyamine antiporter